MPLVTLVKRSWPDRAQNPGLVDICVVRELQFHVLNDFRAFNPDRPSALSYIQCICVYRIRVYMFCM